MLCSDSPYNLELALLKLSESERLEQCAARSRIVEHKHFEFGRDAGGRELPGTIISREFSTEWKPGDEPYYPPNDERNAELYARYAELAAGEENVVFGGRLDTYKYYDMALCIAAALHLAREELER